MSHEMVVRTCTAAGRHRFLLTPEDRLWDPLPMFHMSSVLPLIACMDAGSRFISAAHFDAGEGLATLQREGVTYGFFAFHAIVQALVDHPSFATTDLSTLRAFNSIGDPGTLRRAQAAFPRAIQISAYGSTETGGVDLLQRADRHARAAGHHQRPSVPRHPGPCRGRRDRHTLRPWRAGRAACPRLLAARALPQRPPSARRRPSTTRAGSAPATSAASTPPAGSPTSPG